MKIPQEEKALIIKRAQEELPGLTLHCWAPGVHINASCFHIVEDNHEGKPGILMYIIYLHPRIFIDSKNIHHIHIGGRDQSSHHLFFSLPPKYCTRCVIFGL